VHYYVKISREYHLICFLIQPKKKPYKREDKEDQNKSDAKEN